MAGIMPAIFITVQLNTRIQKNNNKPQIRKLSESNKKIQKQSSHSLSLKIYNQTKKQYNLQEIQYFVYESTYLISYHQFFQSLSFKHNAMPKIINNKYTKISNNQFISETSGKYLIKPTPSSSTLIICIYRIEQLSIAYQIRIQYLVSKIYQIIHFFILYIYMQGQDTTDYLTFTITLAQHRPTSKLNTQVGKQEILSEGASIWDVETDLQPIYENFNILSYFSPSVGVNLIDEEKFKFNDGVVQGLQFRFGGRNCSSSYVFQLKQKFRHIHRKQEQNKELVVEYYFWTKYKHEETVQQVLTNFKQFRENKQRKQIDTSEKESEFKRLRVIFSIKEVLSKPKENKPGKMRQQNEVQEQKDLIKNIIITIKDQQKWMQNNVLLEHKNNRNKFGRISEKRSATRRRNYTQEEKIKAEQEAGKNIDELPARFRLPQFSTDLQYFYMEPLNRRKKNIQSRHIALALRGGGCKGISYIGAYRAILQNYKILEDKQQGQNLRSINVQQKTVQSEQFRQRIKITSIIGSSSGTMIGLAACCQIHPNKITQLCQKYLSRVTQDKINKTEQINTALLEKYREIIKSFLKDYNIADEHLIDSLQKIHSDEDFKDYLYQLVKNFAGFAGNIALDQLFHDRDDKGVDRKNYCRLLNGKLMTGQKIQTISKEILEILIKNPKFEGESQRFFQKMEQKAREQQTLNHQAQINLPSKIRQQWHNKITMKDLYEITGVEFTCTSVDITNHILRFFNHKTTPNLPVIMAVKMSSAYPIAFEPTYWDKKWGKYYIHYENIRREVDLEGCKFTDGGMLANFPIDFIDNQEMRPMYFSHCKDKQTIMYGVGLSECGQTSTIRHQLNDPLTKCDKIKRIGKMNATKLALQYLGINSPKTKQIDVTEIDPLQRLRKIPLFDFGFNLLLTYSSTKDKLAKQAFRHLIYEIQPSQTVIEYLKDRDNSNKNIFNDLQKLENTVTQIINTGRNASEVDVLIKNLEYLKCQDKQISTEYEILQLQERLDIIVENLIFNFLSFFNHGQKEIKRLLLERVRQTFDQNRRLPTSQRLIQIPANNSDQAANNYLNRVLFQLGKMKFCKLFVLSNLEEDLRRIRRMAEQTILIVKQIYGRTEETILRNKIKEYNSNVFIPLSYLENQRKMEISKLQKFKEKMAQSTVSKKYKALKQNLRSIIKTLQEKTALHYKNQQKMKNVLNQIRQIQQAQEQYENIRKLLKKFKNYLDMEIIDTLIQNFEGIETILNKIIYEQYFGSTDLIRDLADLQSCIMTFSIKEIDQINTTIGNFTSCIELVVGYEHYKKPQNILSYIKRTIKQYKNRQQDYRGLHIVMQSAPISQIYLLNILQIIKYYHIKTSALLRNSNLSYPITSITASNIQSIAAILYSSDLNTNLIKIYTNEIKDLKYEYSGNFIQTIENNIRSGQWAKKQPVRLRDLILLYSHQMDEKNVFANLENRLNDSAQFDENNFGKQMNKVLKKTIPHDQRLIQYIEQSMHYVIDQVYKINQKQCSIKDKLKELQQKLSLQLGQKSTKNDDETIKPMMELAEQLRRKYVNLLKTIVENSQYIAQQLTIDISKGQKKDAWKGLILGKIHESLKIKNIVQRIMVDLGLAINTTLQQFYQASSKKITLNFSVITTKSECIQVYNRHTRPYMPVWAAVVASSSLIQFFQALHDKKQWGYTLIKNFEERKVKDYFSEPCSSSHNLYSADSLRKLPIDLLRNEKVQKKVTNDNQIQEIFLIFGMKIRIDYVDKLKKSQQNKEKRNIIKVQNMNLKQFISLIENPATQNMLRIPLIQDYKKHLTLYMNSHDQLIENLYKKQIIMLPTRFNTVDFHLICDNVADDHDPNIIHRGLSKISKDSIMQAYYVMTEKIRIQRAIQYQVKQNKQLRKYLYFKIEKNQNITKQNPHKLAIRFLSKLVPHKDFRQDYKLYYKQDPGKQYQQIKGQTIKIQTLFYLFLKIEYVDIKVRTHDKSEIYELKMKQFQLSMAQFSQIQNEFTAVYCLQYAKSIKQVLMPQRQLESCGILGHFKDVPISVTLGTGLEEILAEELYCDNCHRLKMKQLNKDTIFFNNPLINIRIKIPFFICPACKQSNQPKTQYKISERYKVKWSQKGKNNKLTCNLGHRIFQIKRKDEHPWSMQLAECYKCGKNCRGGFFKDGPCRVYTCYNCMYDLVKNQS